MAIKSKKHFPLLLQGFNVYPVTKNCEVGRAFMLKQGVVE